MVELNFAIFIDEDEINCPLTSCSILHILNLAEPNTPLNDADYVGLFAMRKKMYMRT